MAWPKNEGRFWFGSFVGGIRDYLFHTFQPIPIPGAVVCTGRWPSAGKGGVAAVKYPVEAEELELYARVHDIPGLPDLLDFGRLPGPRTETWSGDVELLMSKLGFIYCWNLGENVYACGFTHTHHIYIYIYIYIYTYTYIYIYIEITVRVALVFLNDGQGPFLPHFSRWPCWPKEKGEFYMAMSKIEPCLDILLRGQLHIHDTSPQTLGRISWPVVAGMGLRLLRTLQAIHKRGILVGPGDGLWGGGLRRS